jgi:zinc and cadmium transporter
VLGISVLSFAGGLVLALGPTRVRKVLPWLVALSAGALLGNVFLHLLPEAVGHMGGFSTALGGWVLGGLLLFFVIESALHWHHHGEDVELHAHAASHAHAHGHVHTVAWMNLLGDLLHNIIDGMLVAGAWLVGPDIGMATTLAVALHEIPQEFGDLGVLLHAGLSPRRALTLNFLSAAGALGGAVVVLTLGKAVHVEHQLVPLAAGGFLYVACADLVPELRRGVSGKGLPLTVLALLAGIALVALVPGHPGHGGH